MLCLVRNTLHPRPRRVEVKLLASTFWGVDLRTVPRNDGGLFVSELSKYL